MLKIILAQVADYIITVNIIKLTHKFYLYIEIFHEYNIYFQKNSCLKKLYNIKIINSYITESGMWTGLWTMIVIMKKPLLSYLLNYLFPRVCFGIPHFWEVDDWLLLSVCTYIMLVKLLQYIISSRISKKFYTSDSQLL